MDIVKFHPQAIAFGLLLCGFAFPAGAQAVGAVAQRIPTEPMSFTHAALSRDTRVGINLADIAPSLTGSVVFVDAMKQATPWSSNVALKNDRDGNITALAPGQVAETEALASQSYPSGDYLLLYDGKGSFSIQGAAIVQSAPGRIVVRLAPSHSYGIRLQLTAIDPIDYIRDVRLILPGFEATYQTHPFHPAFVTALERFHVLRFKNWAHADSSASSATWLNRPTASRFTQVGVDGIALEYQVALANATGDDPWFTIPVGATDYYIAQLAQLVHATLDPRVHPIFEYGDEVWRPGTLANAYAQMAGRNFRLAPVPQTAAIYWYSLRSVQAFNIIKRTFGLDASRTVCVISGPLGVPGSVETANDRQILSYANASRSVDAFALAAGDLRGAQDGAFLAALQSTASFVQAQHLSLLAYEGPSYGESLEMWHAIGGAAFVTNASDVASSQKQHGIDDYMARHPYPHIMPMANSFSPPIAPQPSPWPQRSTFRPVAAPLVNPAVQRNRATIASAGPTPPPPDITTFHNDNMRSGWNPSEAILATNNVASSSFVQLGQLRVDGNVLAQPLFVGQYNVPRKGLHNLLIVATEHNSIYAFDADTLQQIWHVNLGKSQKSDDVGCRDIYPEYGITSTPVINRTGPGSGTIYVVAASEPSALSFRARLHALDIGTGAKQQNPTKINASALLTNGFVIRFDAQNQMSRTSLFMSNGSIYVGIGSHCDNNASAITGWMLRYNTALQQVGAFNTVDDSAGYSLASIWMSGYASTVDGTGNIYFVTGNGAFDASTGGKNYGESVVKLSADLKQVLGYFTPQNFDALNVGDLDLGSGGAMLLPGTSDLIARGKDGRIFLLNAGTLGGLQNNDAGALQIYQDTGGTWGGPAYFRGPNNAQYIYSQGDGNPLRSFIFNGSQLSLFSNAPDSGGFGGSSPVVSSNGSQVGTGIVWVAQRGLTVTLEAYDATNLASPLFKASAGTWSNPVANPFVSPLVVDGRVFVGATGTVTIFGLRVTGATRSVGTPAASTNAFAHHLTGAVIALKGSMLTLRLRNGQLISVDIAEAQSKKHTGILPTGRPVIVYGERRSDGIFHVTSIGHTAPSVQNWSPDSL